MCIFRKLIRTSTGSVSMEYGLIAAIIAIFTIGAVASLGTAPKTQTSASSTNQR